MGLENEDNLLAMEEELNMVGPNKNGSAQDTFEVTFSITFDEDDDNKLNLNLAELFEAPADKGIYSVKVSCSTNMLFFG